MDLQNIKRVYLIGIGGIGMSALARYFKHKGCAVAGFDRSETALTRALEEEGIGVTTVDDEAAIDPGFDEYGEDLLVVRTPAIPAENLILQYFQEEGSVYKRSEVLGAITQDHQTLAVAGTHGKTTISCMLAYLLTTTGAGCKAFLGGIATNYNSNVLLAESSNVVVEADEYDRSFLQLAPNICVISSLDADHLDIYGKETEMVDAYRELAGLLKKDGKLLVHESVAAHIPAALIYGQSVDANYRACNIEVVNGQYSFDLQTPHRTLQGLQLNMPGRHNVENATAALAIALEMGVEGQDLKAALPGFLGVKRRFEYHLRSPELYLIDDYAHHPTEIAACIAAVREVHPGKKITGVFQPHLYSRTRDHADRFASSLAALDELVLLEIYPAREEPIPGVDSAMLLAKVPLAKKVLRKRKELLDDLRERELEVLLTMGAGDIDRLLEPIKEMLNEKERA